MSKLKEINRRELLKFLGLVGCAGVASPLAMLAESIVSGVTNRAYAQSTGINPRAFLYIQLAGAPQRWVHDLFLTPYGSAGFVNNGMVITRYTSSGGRYVGGEYATTTQKGIQVPWMWQFSIPVPGGGTRPMSDLLDNLLALQGLDAGTESHSGGRTNVFLPLGSLQSITALSADYATSPIKAVQHSTTDYVFKSLKGFSNVNVTGTNLLTSLMAPFSNATSSTYNTKKGALKSFLDTATLSLSDQAKMEHQGGVTVEADRKTASDLLAQAVGDMNTFWTNGVNKYRDLIRRATDPANQLVGLTDQPIGITGTRGRTYRHNEDANGDIIVTDADMRTLIDGTQTIDRLAEEFTLAEYLFKNRLSHSLSIKPGGLIYKANGGTSPTQFDEHTVGSMVSLITNTFHYRAFAACLLELITQLKAANVFNDTVIAIMGEFGRAPRTSGIGSDHARYASNAVFYSGAIQGPLILGRFRANSAGSYSGTWGEGDGSRDYGSLLVSTAAMLRVPTPLTARNTMVTLNAAGQVVAAAEKSTLY